MEKYRNVLITGDEIVADFNSNKEDPLAKDIAYLSAFCFATNECVETKIMSAFTLGMAYERVGVDDSVKPENY